MAHGNTANSVECYFDESGSHDGSPVLCVAGYIFSRESREALEVKWKQVLSQYGLPHFHMAACAQRTTPFNTISRDAGADAEKKVIKLINDHALLGLAIAINEPDYDYLMTRQDITGDAYSFCCWQILAGVQAWIARNNFEGRISYFFEAGHKSQRRANAIMKRIFEDESLRIRYRYETHGFVEKNDSSAVQAADILAWQQATQMKRWLKNEHRVRADFQALVKNPPHELFIANRKTLGGVIAYQRYLERLPITDAATGRFGNFWFWSPFDGEPGISFRAARGRF
ncbi:DUF3800 domain-containing protein [Bradyrhizobium sp. CIAT3101]|uniref:DUF3800 domain-containing protein n=1 Tax=Bradyrhizobium sp. CIAT3101 TaxID=439387 RepID=UPI0024B0BEFD|nr:DUF3800 domain-containing protein [Bradyrhizobium sp. CIAT3101]WFU84381.1 DUF3800 domain-containing protein [Bradyrhizobium sp. CIAT3101]